MLSPLRSRTLPRPRAVTLRVAIGAAIVLALAFQGAGSASAAVAPTVAATNAATDLGPVTQPNGYTGDCGFTAQMADGNVLWVYCDTFHYLPFFRMVHSAAALAMAATPTTQIQPALPVTFVPLTPADIAKRTEVRLTDPGVDVANWPSAIVRVPGDRVLVFYDRVLVSMKYGTMTGFGSGIASFQYTPAMMQGTTNLQATTIAEDVFGQNEAKFKMAPSYSMNGYLYIFANDPVTRTRNILARVTPALVGQRSAYTFWDGAAWVADVSKAADTTPNIYPAVMGGAVVKWLPGAGVYAMSYPPFPTGYTHQVAVRFSTNITGPWTTPTTLELPGCTTTKGCYHGLLHEQLFGGNKLVVSFFDRNIALVRAATFPVAKAP